MKEKWVVSAKGADFKTIGEHFGIDPVIARIMRNRGLTDLEEMEHYLHGDEKDLIDPHLLKDVDLAAEIILKKAKEQKKIRIIGDYDIDGIQSTYILYCALQRIGTEADFVIPHRIRDGYGMNEHLVTQAAEAGIDTILTCDNGISAIDQIHLAKELGMTVVVTDHHEVPYIEENGVRREKISEADAIVNPKQEACQYPFKKLCGAVVAWKLVQVLYEHAGIPVSEADRFIENAGFATVGDVMDLQGENRVLVKLGLKMLNQTQNIGMKALILQSNRKLGEIRSGDIAFGLGPCLNATGRLESARIALKLLLCESEAEAAVLAQEAVELNNSRKLLTEQAVEVAKQMIAEGDYANDRVFVIFLPDCHESLAGIVAGRIREAYHRPTLVITRSEEGAKGSGRSIEGYSMFEELNKCTDLLSTFGGHPMAAGFSLPEENIEEFRRRLNENAKLTEDDFTAKIWIDVPMPLEYITEDLVQEFKRLEPFGQGNEKPLFAQKNLGIRSARVLGRNRNVVRLSLVTEGGFPMDGIWFGQGDEFMEQMGQFRRMDAVYYPDINEYNGNRSLQIVVKNFRFR